MKKEEQLIEQGAIYAVSTIALATIDDYETSKKIIEALEKLKELNKSDKDSYNNISKMIDAMKKIYNKSLHKSEKRNDYAS